MAPQTAVYTSPLPVLINSNAIRFGNGQTTRSEYITGRLMVIINACLALILDMELFQHFGCLSAESFANERLPLVVCALKSMHFAVTHILKGSYDAIINNIPRDSHMRNAKAGFFAPMTEVTKQFHDKDIDELIVFTRTYITKLRHNWRRLMRNVDPLLMAWNDGTRYHPPTLATRKAVFLCIANRNDAQLKRADDQPKFLSDIIAAINDHIRTAAQAGPVPIVLSFKPTMSHPGSSIGNGVARTYLFCTGTDQPASLHSDCVVTSSYSNWMPFGEVHGLYKRMRESTLPSGTIQRFLNALNDLDHIVTTALDEREAKLQAKYANRPHTNVRKIAAKEILVDLGASFQARIANQEHHIAYSYSVQRDSTLRVTNPCLFCHFTNQYGLNAGLEQRRLKERYAEFASFCFRTRRREPASCAEVEAMNTCDK